MSGHPYSRVSNRSPSRTPSDTNVDLNRCVVALHSKTSRKTREMRNFVFSHEVLKRAKEPSIGLPPYPPQYHEALCYPGILGWLRLPSSRTSRVEIRPYKEPHTFHQ